MASQREAFGEKFRGRFLNSECARSLIWIWIDVSEACNLDCVLCYSKHLHTKKLMEERTFVRILENLKKANLDVHTLHLNWRAEPFINKNLEEFVALRNELLPEARIELHTNGYLVSKGRAEKLIRNMMHEDRVYVSIDGGGRDAHERNRGPGSWKAAVDALSNLLDARDSSHLPAPEVGIYEIRNSSNKDYSRILMKLGFRSDVWTRVGAVESDGNSRDIEDERTPNAACFWAGNAFCVDAMGNAYVCLLSNNQKSAVLGNLATDDADAVYKKCRSFRAALQKIGRSRIDLCMNCKKPEGCADVV